MLLSLLDVIEVSGNSSFIDLGAIKLKLISVVIIGIRGHLVKKYYIDRYLLKIMLIH